MKVDNTDRWTETKDLASTHVSSKQNGQIFLKITIQPKAGPKTEITIIDYIYGMQKKYIEIATTLNFRV